MKNILEHLVHFLLSGYVENLWNACVKRFDMSEVDFRSTIDRIDKLRMKREYTCVNKLY